MWFLHCFTESIRFNLVLNWKKKRKKNILNIKNGAVASATATIFFSLSSLKALKADTFMWPSIIRNAVQILCHLNVTQFPFIPPLCTLLYVHVNQFLLHAIAFIWRGRRRKRIEKRRSVCVCVYARYTHTHTQIFFESKLFFVGLHCYS